MLDKCNKNLELRYELLQPLATAISRDKICRILQKKKKLEKSFFFHFFGCFFLKIPDLLHKLLDLSRVDCSKRALMHISVFVFVLVFVFSFVFAFCQSQQICLLGKNLATELSSCQESFL